MSNIRTFVNQADKTADIYIYGDIGYEVDGNFIAELVRAYDEQGIEIINQHINSGGGSILNGLSIVSANLNCKTAKIHTYNDGVAASMAGIIFLTGAKRIMADYSLLMIHEPSLNGNTIDTSKDENTRNALTALKSQLLTIIGGMTGKTNFDLEQIMAAETWYTANQAKKMGFADEIISLPRAKNIFESANHIDILQAVNSLYMNKLKTTCNSCGEVFDFDKYKNEIGTTAECPKCGVMCDNKGNKLIKTKQMENLKDAVNVVEPVAPLEAEIKVSDFINSLGLKSFEDLKNKIENYENIVELLKAKDQVVLDLQAKVNEFAKSEIVSIIENAVSVGKITGESKDEWVNRFENNLDGLNFVLGNMVTPAKNIMANVVIETKNEIALPHNCTSLREFENKYPGEVSNWAFENEDMYKKAYKAQYNVEL